MLDTIRRHQQSWLTYLIFLAIIVVFAVNFGPGSSGCRGVAGTSYAAMVDGDVIRQQEFALLYSRRLEALRERFRGSNFELTNEMVERMGLRTQIIDQMVNTKLLAHEATKRGLKVSDPELLDYLDRSFGVRSVSEQQYRSFVERNFQSTVTRFEDEMRTALLAQKMERFLTENVSVGDAELKTEFMREHDRAMVDYVKVEISSDVAEPSAAEIDKLLADEHKAVEARFATDAIRYRTPEQRRARQIVLSLGQDASDADVAKARSKLNEIKGKIDSGADFAALAKEVSQDEASKAQGGDMGWLKRGELPKTLEDAAYVLKTNEITTEPVRTLTGMHLLQVTEIKPPQSRELKEVEREVALSVLRDRAAESYAKNKAETLLGQLRGGKELASLTQTEEDSRGATGEQAKRLVRHESQWIIKSDQAIPSIGLAPDLHSEIFTLSPQSPVANKVYKVGKAYYVAVLKQRETPDLSKFDTEKPQLREQAIRDKQGQVSQAWIRNLRESANVDLNPALFGREEKSKG